jgi:ornithine cyclodeaminase/alanine dehydrogenase-like protein (mu-crystallin family)
VLELKKYGSINFNMSLTILSDHDVKTLLLNLNPKDVSSLLSVFTKTLQSYSAGQEAQYQCHRQAVTRPGGPTMLFMPATLEGSGSIKVVGVPPPSQDGKQSKPIVGAIMVFDADGRATGVINAAETTAFRTSLGSIALYHYRDRTKHIVVFGAGRQALWHLRLAMILRGSDIETVAIINRSLARAEQLIRQLGHMDKDGYSTTATTNIKFSILSSSSHKIHDEYQAALYNYVVEADVIFCTTPSTEPVFPSAWLTSERGRQKTRFISAIGSYKLDMQEIDPELLQNITRNTDKSNQLPGLYYYDKDHLKARQATRGSIIVDSREACAIEAGEVVKAQVPDEYIVELGELNKYFENTDNAKTTNVSAWLADGLVIYKSVGIGIMDLAISNALLELATTSNQGITVDYF